MLFCQIIRCSSVYLFCTVGSADVFLCHCYTSFPLPFLRCSWSFRSIFSSQKFTRWLHKSILSNGWFVNSFMILACSVLLLPGDYVFIICLPIFLWAGSLKMLSTNFREYLGKIGFGRRNVWLDSLSSIQQFSHYSVIGGSWIHPSLQTGLHVSSENICSRMYTANKWLLGHYNIFKFSIYEITACLEGW